MKLPPSSLSALLLAAVTLLIAACSSGPNRKAMLEEARHSIPPMAGDQPFFDGQVIVHLTLVGNMSEAGLRKPADGRHGKVRMGATSTLGSGREMDTGGNFDLDEQSRDQGRGNAEYGSYDGNPGMGGVTREDNSQPVNTRRWDSEMPPALLRLRLENTSAATVVVQVREFNSALGNFAVRPDTLTLEPGQSAEVDPVQSLLGLETFSLPVTVGLRAGGNTETKVVTLKLVNAAPTSADPSR